MKWFLDFKTRSKFYVSFGLMIALMVGVIVIAYGCITAIKESQKNLYQVSFANTQDLLTLRAEQSGVRAALLSMMAITQRSEQDAWQQDINERGKNIDAITRRLLERNRNNPHLSGKLEQLDTIREAFAQTRDTIIPLVYAGKTEQARVLALGIQDERYQKMRAIAQQLGSEAAEQARTAVAESEQLAHEAVRLLTIIGIVATVLAVIIDLFMNRIIAEPLRTVSDIAERVASGDLTVNVPE